MAMCFRISLMFVIMTADVDGQQVYRVNYSPSYVCAPRGSSVKISCSSQYPVYRNFWIKTSYVSYGESSDLCLYTEYQCLSDQYTHSITLTHVTAADNIYYCGFIPGGQRTNLGAQLHVTELQVETQQRVKEGDSVTLTCQTTCRLTEETTFIWYRNIQILTKGSITVNQLHLQSVSPDDSGVYRCAIRGYEHLFSTDVYLDVEYPTKKSFVSISPSGEIVEGDSVTLTCSTESNPPVHHYSWFKGNSLVASGNIYRITNLTSDHSGEYKCKAINKHGERHTEAVMLNVMYAPRNVVASISPSGEIVEGDSVTLTCSCESNPPVQIYSWFKENEASAVGSGQTFIITNFNSSHSGWFYCKAQNEVGSQKSAAVSVTVTGVQGSALYTVSGMVAGCGGLFFIIIIIFIILLIWKKRSDDGSVVNRQNQDNRYSRSAGAASSNDVPLYALVSANQSEASESADVDEVQYASVQHHRKKEMMKEQKDCQYMNFIWQHNSDPHM